jgi:hypothetical protein
MDHYQAMGMSTLLTVTQLKSDLFGASESSYLASQKKPTLLGRLFIDRFDNQFPCFRPNHR